MNSKRHREWLSRSAAATKRIGKVISGLLKKGDVVALFGELGAGKTTLVKGMAKGLGVKHESQVASPTYTLIHEYQGRCRLFHMDWYRLDSLNGADRELAEEHFGAQGITLIEWADRGQSILPEQHLRIDIEHKGPRKRRIRLHAVGHTRDLSK